MQREARVMSKATFAFATTAMRASDLVLTRVTASACADFDPFTWTRPSDKHVFSEEEEAKPLLLAHLWEQLCAAMPPASSSDEPSHRAPLGLAAYCQPVDARALPLSLVVVDTARAVTTTVTGHPDAVLTDINASVDFLIASVLPWACLVIYWKTPKELACATPQAIMELMATCHLTGEAVPVVFTDCATRMHVWMLEGRVLSEYVRAVDGQIGLTLQEGCGLLTQVLCPPTSNGCLLFWTRGGTSIARAGRGRG